MNGELSNFWAAEPEKVLKQLQSSPNGLTQEEAKERLKKYGKNILQERKEFGALRLLFSQFNTPIIYLLLLAAIIALILYDRTDALIILAIIIVSGLLSFIQERGALQAVEKLLNLVRIKANILRDNSEVEVPIEEVVPGDLLLLTGGDMIPADCCLLDAKELQVDESTLTGESNPSEKELGVIDQETPISKRSNSLFMGTHVVSGSAKALVVLTGKNTEFGKISDRLKAKTPENAFEKGVRTFGYLLLAVTLILITLIFGFNLYFGRPLIESLLFSLALAVGLTPQLLPAIVTINLAYGAKEMAQKKVIVKKLASIENFGSMNIFCTDKTGTLTEGKLEVKLAVDVQSKESEKVMRYAMLNAYFQSSYKNPIDQALLHGKDINTEGWEKQDEIPYDFNRKKITILVKHENQQLMLSKGAVKQIFEMCKFVETQEGRKVDFSTMKDQLEKQFVELSLKGNRVLGIAYKNREGEGKLKTDDEKEMTFLGFLLFADPLKKNVKESLDKLKQMGISMKLITGDNKHIAMYLAKEIGFAPEQVMVGTEMSKMDDEELKRKAENIEIFAEIEPNQKERIILALRSNDHIVGYLGDGINDVTALHAADVSISVDSAADAAKEVANIILLEKELDVLSNGVLAGRKTFANTLKYIFMATSANFGNMFSMAGASLFLSFLPLLPKQILLTNLMTDFPEMTIATDHVDKEMIERPQKWDIRFIRNFMILFGLISSIFDYLTFGLLLWVLKASEVQFRTGWFMESVISASVIVLVIRTFKPFYTSRPSIYLLSTVLLIVLATIILPYTPFAHYLGFQPLPIYFLFYIAMILVLYIICVEIGKKIFNLKWRRE